MKWSKYSTLKSAKKVVFEKVSEVKDSDDKVVKKAYIVLTQKLFDSETGETLPDSKIEYSLYDLESRKALHDSQLLQKQKQNQMD